MSGRCMTHNSEDVKISVKIVLITKNRATASEAELSFWPTVFLGDLYPSHSCTQHPQNYVHFRTTRLKNERRFFILWQKNPGISLTRQVI